jgi:hypothetical protein
MIKIRTSATADSRSCDFAKVSRDRLRVSTMQHISDVRAALEFFIDRIRKAEWKHDYDKLELFEEFYRDFKSGFADPNWLPKHYENSRHHLFKNVPPDVNLIDILEMVADIVTAGMGRGGSVYPLELPDELLQKAVTNTVELLKKEITLIE